MRMHSLHGVISCDKPALLSDNTVDAQQQAHSENHPVLGEIQSNTNTQRKNDSGRHCSKTLAIAHEGLDVA